MSLYVSSVLAPSWFSWESLLVFLWFFGDHCGNHRTFCWNYAKVCKGSGELQIVPFLNVKGPWFCVREGGCSCVSKLDSCNHKGQYLVPLCISQHGGFVPFPGCCEAAGGIYFFRETGSRLSVWFTLTASCVCVSCPECIRMWTLSPTWSWLLMKSSCVKSALVMLCGFLTPHDKLNI